MGNLFAERASRIFQSWLFAKLKKLTRELILYDFMLVQGGAESVTQKLCQAFPSLDLGVGFINKTSFPNTDFMLGKCFQFSSPTFIPGWQSLKVSYAFENRTKRIINNYDKVIYSGNNAPLAIKNRAKNGNILYCHTPPRYIYDLKHYYLSTIPVWQRPLLQFLINYFKPKFENALNEMDLVIANSQNVQARLLKYNNRNSTVIYPPCDTDKFSWLSQGDYFLSTARIEPYKRVRKIVEAFMLMPDKNLIVTSGGSELESLISLASGYSNIKFTGWCSDQELKRVMGNCIATIYLPIDEDFGISPVESMSAGKPVIGVNDGGVKETVIDGATGFLCPKELSTDDICAALEFMSKEQALKMKSDCIKQSQKFSSDIFTKKMADVLNLDNGNLKDYSA